MHVNLNIGKDYYKSIPFNGEQFKVFLLPDSMTIAKQYNINIVKSFLNSMKNEPTFINKIIKPKKESVINIGFLIEADKKLNPLPMVLFSKHEKYKFNSIPDSIINKIPSINNQIKLFLGLDFLMLSNDTIKRYTLIPCGQITYSNLKENE